MSNESLFCLSLQVSDPVDCYYCGENFNNLEELNAHYKAKHNSAEKYACFLCDMLYASKYTLKHHIVKKHNVEKTDDLEFFISKKTEGKIPIPRIETSGTKDYGFAPIVQTKTLEDYPLEMFPELEAWGLTKLQWARALKDTPSGPHLGVFLMKMLFSKEERMDACNFNGMRGRPRLDPTGERSTAIVRAVMEVYPETKKNEISKNIDSCNRALRIRRKDRLPLSDVVSPLVVVKREEESINVDSFNESFDDN